MPNTLLGPWVKNVYNLCTSRGGNGALLSTVSSRGFMNPQLPVNNPLVLPQFIQSQTTPLSTGKFTISPLLMSSYTRFPQHLLLLRLKKKSER